VTRLETVGHQVTTPAQAGIRKAADSVHFHYAQSNGLVLLTKNPKDFLALHAMDQTHSGILLVYQDNDPSRDMTSADIVRAIKNLEDAGVVFQGNCHSLNAWRY
jgi:hypothetical protein